jgi:hypothetical protein
LRNQLQFLRSVMWISAQTRAQRGEERDFFAKNFNQ